MKKEDLQNSQQGIRSLENKSESRDQQKSPATNISNNGKENKILQAGLGRDRMTDIDDLEGLNGRDDYAGNTNDDLTNENLNAANDR